MCQIGVAWKLHLFLFVSIQEDIYDTQRLSRHSAHAIDDRLSLSTFWKHDAVLGLVSTSFNDCFELPSDNGVVFLALSDFCRK